MLVSANQEKAIKAEGRSLGTEQAEVVWCSNHRQRQTAEPATALPIAILFGLIQANGSLTRRRCPGADVAAGNIYWAAPNF
jgi:hypothetical protein